MAEDMEQQVNAIFAHQGKVICGECSYYHARGARQCWHPHAEHVTLTWHGEETTYDPPSSRNQHNDCQDVRMETVGEMIAKNPAVLVGRIVPILGAGFGLYCLACWLF